MTHLTKKIIITGVVKTLTGLHIGGTNSAMGIGGPDKLVVRNPIDNRPYIPGSSLKGKLRAVTDLANGTIASVRMGAVKNASSQEPNSISVLLFGSARSDDAQRPSKVIIRDGKMLTPEEKLKGTDLPFTESKTEVVIDRITAKAMPRTNERVPAGVEFELNMVLNVFEGDDQNNQLSNLKKAIRLLEDDYLGGHGSRGYGQVEINVTNVEERDMAFYANGQAKGTDITENYKAL